MSNRKELTFGAGLWMFGQFVDRYATDAYGPPVGVLEAIDRAGQVGDMVALDINYPFDEGVTTDQVRKSLERNRLRCYAITPPIPGRLRGPLALLRGRGARSSPLLSTCDSGSSASSKSRAHACSSAMLQTRCSQSRQWA